MAHNNMLRRFLKDQVGATMVEFAIVSLVFFTLMCGVMEYGLILLTKIAIESAVEQSSRSSAINSPGTTGCASRAACIQALIAQKTGGLVNPTSVLVTAKVITAPTDAAPAKPDVCRAGGPIDADPCGPPSSNPACTHGSGPYEENNGTGCYEPNSIDPGEKNDLVQLSVFYKWEVMFPLMRPFFRNGIYEISSTTVVKDEPF